MHPEAPTHATRSPAAAALSSPVSLLVFTLDGERFALRAEDVERVVRAVAIAALPQAPAIVEGVINVAGAIVPVLDVRQRFRLPSRPLDPDQHFVIARAGPRTVALRVDRAEDVITVDQDAIEAASRSTPGVGYVAGIVKLEDGLLVIHDLQSFLALEEVAQLEAAITGAAR